MIAYGEGTRSSAQVRFDLGSEGRVPRFHIMSTYEGASGAQTVERITIGDQSWQRKPASRWTARPAREGVWAQVQVFLPHADAVAHAERESDTSPAVLRWYDAGRDAGVTLVVDPTTGIPLELRRVTHATGAVLTVTYRAWNMAVEITPPEGA